MKKVQQKVIDGQIWIKFDKEFDRWKYRHGLTLSFVLVVVLIVFATLFYFKIFNHLESFTENPLIFGAKQIEEHYDAPITCQCFAGRYAYHWNATSFFEPALENPEYIYKEINFSELIGGG